MDFKNSETKKNLMRAFAGESQARNRYTFGAELAKEQKLYVIEKVFLFTANQEKEHAEIFYNHLKEETGENIEIDAAYPVNVSESVEKLLTFAVDNEYDEYNVVYKNFADIADGEGFKQIAASFRNIAEIERIHGERFKCFAELLQKGKLFTCDEEEKWMCLNCGHVINIREVPPYCPVCGKEQGHFIRINMAPYTKRE